MDPSWPPREWLEQQPMPPGGVPDGLAPSMPPSAPWPPPEWGAQPGAPSPLSPTGGAMDALPGGLPVPPRPAPAAAPPPGQAPQPPGQPAPTDGVMDPYELEGPTRDGAPLRAAPPPSEADQFEARYGNNARVQRDAILAGGDRESQAAELEAARAMEANQNAQAGLKQAQEVRAASTAQAKEDVAALRAEADEISQGKVDPDRVWSNASTPQKIAASIGIALGGMLTAYGHRNAALDMINTIIDRDLQAQRENLANRRAGLEQKRGLVAMAADMGKDEYDAALQTTLVGYDMAKQAALAEAAKVRSPAAKENALAVASQFEEQRESAIAQAEAAREQMLYQRAVEAQKLKLERSRVGQGWAQIKEGKRQFDENQKFRYIDHAQRAMDSQLDRALKMNESSGPAGAVDGVPRELVVNDTKGKPLRNADGSVMVARDKDDAKKASVVTAKYRQWRTKLESYEALAKDARYAGWGPNSEQAKLAAQAHTDLMLEAKNMYELGVLSGPDLDLMKAVVPGPNSLTTSDPSGRLKKLREMADYAVDNQMHSYGYQGDYSQHYLAPVDSFEPSDTQPTAGSRMAPRGLPPAGTETPEVTLAPHEQAGHPSWVTRPGAPQMSAEEQATANLLRRR
jgi:hypothetical protein